MSDEKWIPHTGDACPVDNFTTVRVMFRSGRISEKYAAGELGWNIESSIADIVAYCVVEPAPEPTGIEAEVTEFIAQRQQAGIKKYGTTVEDNDLSPAQWLQHAIEETADQLIYMWKLKKELEKGE